MTDILQGHDQDEHIERRRTLWEMSRNEIIDLWKSQGYSSEHIEHELSREMKGWGASPEDLYEWQTELQELLFEWRTASQLRIAQASIERSQADTNHKAAINALILFKQTHGIETEADISTDELRQVYRYLKEQIDQTLLDLNVIGAEYAGSTEELLELGVVKGEFYGKIQVRNEATGDVHDEFWGEDIYDHMPANKPAIS